MRGPILLQEMSRFYNHLILSVSAAAALQKGDIGEVGLLIL